jgi:hypothetical protein
LLHWHVLAFAPARRRRTSSTNETPSDEATTTKLASPTKADAYDLGCLLQA